MSNQFPAMLKGGVNEFGEAIRQARLALGKTLQEVAAKAGVSTSYVGRVERGSLPTPPSDAAIVAMCSALSLDPSPFLEMRKSFYRTGRSRPLRPGNVVEVALNDIAALGEQAFRAAEEQAKNGNIDGALQLAEIALSHLESSRRHGSVARVGHLLASLHLDRLHRDREAVDPTEQRIRALSYYEVAVGAFRRIAKPTADDRQKLYDTIAQSARQFEALSDITDHSHLPLTLTDFDKWPEIVSLTVAATDRIKLVQGLAESIATWGSETLPGESRSDAQILSGLMASHLARCYADELYTVAENRNRELLEDLRKLTPSVESLVMAAMVTTNLAGALIDHTRMTSKPISMEPFKIVEELAMQLKTFMATAVSSDRGQLTRRLQKCHQELGSWHAAESEVKEAVWHLYVALKLDPGDSLGKAMYINDLLSSLTRNRPELIKTMWSWLEQNVSEEEFNSLTYSIAPPEGMPNEHQV
ncbi:MAG: hypothetical protein CNCCGFBP_00309 [Fimbriimonadaceae bacterium]|nr:hypothetical protein [Fimbriimonadaceae bacterium]